jgi:cytoskeletal protein CcmA (bactofilin family)
MRLRLPAIRRRQSSSIGLTSELFIHEPAKAKGNLVVSDDLVIDAAFIGNITSNSHVTIGPNAVIEGAVSARSVRHQGSLEGSIAAQSQIVLQGGSRLVHSSLHSESIEVQVGSQLSDVNITTK